MATCSASESDVRPLSEEKILNLDENNLRAIAEVYKNEGNDEYRKKRLDNAIYFFTEGINLNVKDHELKAELFSYRAATHFDLGNYSDSLKDAKAAIDLQPTLIKAITTGASASVKLNLFEEAITWCDQGLAIDKENNMLLWLRQMSIARAHEKDTTEALVPKEQPFDVDDDTLRAIAEVYKNEGNNEYRMANFSNAVQMYTEGVKVNFKGDELKAELYSDRAEAHFALGNYSDSLSDSTSANDLNPSIIKAIVTGASSSLMLDQTEEAIAWCDKGLSVSLL